jgi:hypothetical protein
MCLEFTSTHLQSLQISHVTLDFPSFHLYKLMISKIIATRDVLRKDKEVWGILLSIVLNMQTGVVLISCFLKNDLTSWFSLCHNWIWALKKLPVGIDSNFNSELWNPKWWGINGFTCLPHWNYLLMGSRINDTRVEGVKQPGLFIPLSDFLETGSSPISPNLWSIHCQLYWPRGNQIDQPLFCNAWDCFWAKALEITHVCRPRGALLAAWLVSLWRPCLFPLLILFAGCAGKPAVTIDRVEFPGQRHDSGRQQPSSRSDLSLATTCTNQHCFTYSHEAL